MHVGSSNTAAHLQMQHADLPAPNVELCRCQNVSIACAAVLLHTALKRILDTLPNLSVSITACPQRKLHWTDLLAHKLVCQDDLNRSASLVAYSA